MAVRLLAALNILLMVLLGFLVDRYDLIDRAIVRFETNRIPGISEEFNLNPQFALYLDLFDLYVVEDNSTVMVGDSMVSLVDWNQLVYHEKRVVNLGIPRDTVRGVSFRLDRILRNNPAKVVIWVGTNDVLKGHTEYEIIAWFKELMVKLEDHQVTVTFVSIPPVSELVPDSERFNATIKHINAKLLHAADSGQFEFVDVASGLADGEGNLSAEYTLDGIHLNSPGYRQVKKELLP